MVDHDYKNYPELTNTQIEEYGFMSPHKQITEDFYAIVVKVHDGDTITLRYDFRDFDFPLRLLGIDAPELNTGEPGQRARDYVKERCEGEEVEIKIDKDNRVGKYGRLLGRVIHSGTDVGEDELRLGLAWTFDRRLEGELPNMNKELMVEKWL